MMGTPTDSKKGCTCGVYHVRTLKFSEFSGLGCVGLVFRVEPLDAGLSTRDTKWKHVRFLKMGECPFRS